MEIILLLLGNKQGDSEQHGCFSLVLFAPPHPIIRQIRHRDGTPTPFTPIQFLHLLYIKKNRTRHLDASDTYIILKNNLILLKT